jgi:hypothetical protein
VPRLGTAALESNIQTFILLANLKALGFFFNLNYQYQAYSLTRIDGDHEHNIDENDKKEGF